MNTTWYHGKMWFYESEDVYEENGVKMALAADEDGKEERIPVDIRTNGTTERWKNRTNHYDSTGDAIAYYLEGLILEQQEQYDGEY
jgi:hypothetical protein